MKIKLTEEQKQMLYSGHIVRAGVSNSSDIEEWYFIPYYFKTIDEGETFEMISLDKVPNHIKEIISQEIKTN